MCWHGASFVLDQCACADRVHGYKRAYTRGCGHNVLTRQAFAAQRLAAAAEMGMSEGAKKQQIKKHIAVLC